MKTAPSTVEQLALEHALFQVLNRYATAVDTRNLELLKHVFTPDCTATYGGDYVCRGAAEITRMIDVHMGGCGPTQHLLGNLEVDASDPARVRSKIHVRAVHAGLNERAPLRYDAVGYYEDEWVQLPQGWRIDRRSMTLLLEIGDRSVMQPAAA
ncbi:MAG: nuclear transport factor 2 family protein [Comamonas sp.]